MVDMISDTYIYIYLREAMLRARDREIQTFQVGQMAERQKRTQEERQEATTFR